MKIREILFSLWMGLILLLVVVFALCIYTEHLDRIEEREENAITESDVRDIDAGIVRANNGLDVAIGGLKKLVKS